MALSAGETWHLADACWAAGSVDDAKPAQDAFTRRWEPFWWCCPAEHFLDRHFPMGERAQQWQRVKKPISWEEFEGRLERGSDFHRNGMCALSHKAT